MDVCEGPDAGLSLPGTLLTVPELDAGAFAGAGAHLGVPATHASGAVELTFALDAGTIQGIGTDDGGVIAGDLTGPAEGDAGDWLGTLADSVPWAESAVPADDELEACLADAQVGETAGTLVLAEDSLVGLTGFFVPDGGGETLAVSRTADGLAFRDASGAESAYSADLSGSVSGCSATLSGESLQAAAYVATLATGTDKGDITDILVEVPMDSVLAPKAFRLEVRVTPW